MTRCPAAYARPGFSLLRLEISHASPPHQLLDLKLVWGYSTRYNMVDTEVATNVEFGTEEALPRIYEIGYTVNPSVKEEDVEKTVGGIRSAIEKSGGSFIAEGAPALTKLSYPITTLENARKVEYDRGYFGWIKFEAAIPSASTLDEALKHNANVMRFILFRTVREDTRAKMKAPVLREVKRTDVIKSTPRRVEEESTAPVSEAELDKALSEITTE